ncbi:4'-phosphopantetheinyl transferase family protein [Demequina flava]|uniref:4'-phosphopantetheinyl transferase family protein n=1 Tax=Demequina flava TaxID=1095025 RepID=UPI0007842AE0|nr:4'-phosphopantetheinyl transferase superfamily protein [Demequina flava]
MSLQIAVGWRRTSLTPPPPASLARDLAVSTAAQLLGVDPQTLRLSHHCEHCGSAEHGTPVVIGGGSVSVSLSRAEGYAVAVATRAERPLGVDIESESAAPRAELSATAMLSAQERAASKHSPPESLLRTWVQKEALLKACGEGLRYPLESVTIRGDSVVSGPPATHGKWNLAPLLIEGAVAYVAYTARWHERLVLRVDESPQDGC